MKRRITDKKRMDAIRKIFRRNLIHLLKSQKSSHFAEDVGVSKSTVSTWISGKRFPRPEELDKIVKLFNIYPYELFIADDEANSLKKMEASVDEAIDKIRKELGLKPPHNKKR